MNKKFQNYVQKDGVIKEQISMDKKVQNSDRWNFLDLNKMCLEIALKEGFTKKEYRHMTRGCPKSKQTSFEDKWKLTTRQEFPKTTAGEIGWRHEIKNHNLEIYGPLYKSPKLTMAPLYEPQEFIFLG